MINTPESNEASASIASNEALKYLERGFSIIPIIKGGKTPLIDTWKQFQDRKPTSQEVQEWWNKWPEANIALITGAISGVVVIDIENGGSAKSFPPTVTARTGGGGFHLFYKYPGVSVKNSVRDIAPLTDVRGDGGYVVLPPSVHASGNTYEWLVSPWDAEFTELPKEVLVRLTGTERKTNWNDFPNTEVYEGERNNIATQYAGKLLHDLSPELWEIAGWGSLKLWNMGSCKPPLDEKELRSIFESIAKREDKSKPKNTVSTQSKVSTSHALLTRLSDVKPEPISWLWSGRIALGKITLIAGDPGLGKSLLTATLAAHVSKGYAWPIDKSRPPVGDVLLLSAEDDAADTIRPRLDAAEADCSRIQILKMMQDTDASGKQTQRMFSFKRDLVVLEDLLKSLPGCRLIVIDPISAYLEGSDDNNNSDIRGLFAPLAELAARYKVAVVLIQHLNKGGGGNALYRPMGSLAFVATARAVYLVTKDKDNPTRRLLMPSKNNIAKDSTGLAYSVVMAANGAPVVAWELEPVTITADEALAPPDTAEERTATDEAYDFLNDILASGAVKVVDVHREAKQAGISDKSLRRAREKLGIKPQKEDYKGGWVWELSEDAHSSEDAPPKIEGNLGDVGHLHGVVTAPDNAKSGMSDEELFESFPVIAVEDKSTEVVNVTKPPEQLSMPDTKTDL